MVRRYAAGLRNMRRVYLPMMDGALIYDNSDDRQILIAERTLEEPLLVYDHERWALIEEATR